MSQSETQYTGGCLCGALRYEAIGEPLFAGHCYCLDCQKASGSGFIPFLGFDSTAVRFMGEARPYACTNESGTNSVRNFCPVCGSLVFGGEIGKPEPYTIYAGTLDDPSLFHPKVAIFARSRPHWAVIPSGLRVFQAMPTSDPAAGT
jgi:hypothetical protein